MPKLKKNKKITNLFSQKTLPKEGKMKWNSKFGTALKITIVMAFAGAILTSCVQKKDCDLLTDAKKKELLNGTASNKTVKEFGHCDLTEPPQPDPCKDLKDELPGLVTDSTHWASQVIDLENVALVGDDYDFYYRVFDKIAKDSIMPTGTLLEQAKVHVLAIPRFLTAFPDHANKDAFLLWKDACDKYIKSHDKPAQQREDIKECEISNATAMVMTNQEKIKQGSNIMAGSREASAMSMQRNVKVAKYFNGKSFT